MNRHNCVGLGRVRAFWSSWFGEGSDFLGSGSSFLECMLFSDVRMSWLVLGVHVCSTIIVIIIMTLSSHARCLF